MSQAYPIRQARVSRSGQTNEEDTHCEGASDRVKTDVYLMDEVGGIADAHERAAGVDVILSSA